MKDSRDSSVVSTASQLALTQRQQETRQLRPRPPAAADAAQRSGEALVRLQAPAGTSAVHGLSGTLYMADAAGMVAVREGDVSRLLAHGFARVAEE